VQDVIDLKFSNRMLLAERVKRDVIDAVRTTAEASDDAKTGAEILEGWDDKVAPASRGAVLFQRFWDLYSEAVRPPFATPWQEANFATTPTGIADRAAAVRHLEAAVRAVRTQYGSPSVAWGEVNRFRAGALDLPGDGATGTYGTYRVMTFAASDDPKVRVAGHLPGRDTPVGFGDGWVLLVDFSKPGQAWSVLAYGQTTNAKSPHSSDQLQLFADHKLRRAWYSEADIKANLSREYRPQ
jgi:acyl-homoserine-lactone acylase